MRHLAKLLVFPLLLLAHPTGARAEQVTPSPAWEYQFPPGIVDFSARCLTADLRYLAVGTGEWTYRVRGSEEPPSWEGENAVYLFDLREKRLLWKKPFPSGAAPFVVGLSPSGSIIAVEVGGYSATETTQPQWRYEGSSVFEGTRILGPSEAGVRVYDREGRLLGTGVPLERFEGTRRDGGKLLLRPDKAEEGAVPDELWQILTDAGVLAVPGFAESTPYGFIESAQHEQFFASFEEDGSENWRWELPPGEGQFGGPSRVVTVSSDLGYALVSLKRDDKWPSDVRHLYLFGRSEGLLWDREFPMAADPKPMLGGILRYMGMGVANGGMSALVIRTGPRSGVVEVLDSSGATKQRWEFDELHPKVCSLSPNGRYWAAALRQTWRGPTVNDKGWTEGVHVFDCDTGEVVWRSPAMADAFYLKATDTGGVVAICAARRTLAVFDPPR